MTHLTRRTRWKWRAFVLGLLIVAGLWNGWMMFAMPGESYQGPLPPLSAAQRELSVALERDVVTLAEEIGERNVHRPEALTESADWLAQRFESLGYAVSRQSYTVHDPFAGDITCQNIEAEIRGSERPDEIVLFAAHYDTVPGSPGANDNASGVAGLLALARAAADTEPRRTLRLVSFVNEEPPFFQTPEMGSHVYARRSRERGEDIVAMISFDGIGHYTDAPDSQQYPLPGLGAIYPSRGDFIAVTGNLASRELVRRVVGTFRAHAAFPAQGAAIPGIVPEAGWSDHWAFWEHGYPGVMVTDTLPFRYRQYHTADDRPAHLDFERMARVVDGMRAVMFELAGIEPAGEG